MFILSVYSYLLTDLLIDFIVINNPAAWNKKKNISSFVLPFTLFFRRYSDVRNYENVRHVTPYRQKWLVIMTQFEYSVAVESGTTLNCISKQTNAPASKAVIRMHLFIAHFRLHSFSKSKSYHLRKIFLSKNGFWTRSID